MDSPEEIRHSLRRAATAAVQLQLHLRRAEECLLQISTAVDPELDPATAAEFADVAGALAQALGDRVHGAVASALESTREALDRAERPVRTSVAQLSFAQPKTERRATSAGANR